MCVFVTNHVNNHVNLKKYIYNSHTKKKKNTQIQNKTKKYILKDAY